MHNVLEKFWRDDRGCVAMEWIFVASILTLSAFVSLAAMYRAGL